MRMSVRLVVLVAIVAVPSIVVVPSMVEARQQQKRPSAEVQAYLEYRKEVARAKQLEDLYYYLDRQTGEFYRSLSGPERAKILQQLKAQVDLFPQVQVVKEDRMATSVMLTIEATSADNATKAAVTVEILREGASLKVGPSTWK